MAEALYRKYRPQVFEDVVGQEHIERTIKNAIATDKVSHAYLFTGPRGTGKTTTARLLAKALLCEKGPTAEPDGTCDQCMQIAEGSHPDVYELDAASRTGVENVREEIIGRVNYAPTRGRYKVYIIDEVHMLSTAAFNALLKTLEEPPGHVVFIMCTTDPHKVLETIQSRCQRFDFRRISNEEIVSRLGAICMEEGIEFEGDALELVAQRAEGGMRDALTSLEQLITFGEGKVTREAAERMLGALDSTDLAEIVRFIGARDVAACFRWTADYMETGADLAQFVHDLAERVRTMYVMSLAEGHDDLVADMGETARRELTEELPLFGADRLARMLGVLGDLTAELRVATNPRLAFEIALTRMVRPDSDLTLEALAERIEALEQGYSARATGSAAAAAPVATAVAADASAATAAAAPATTGAGAVAFEPAVEAAPAQAAAVAPVAAQVAEGAAAASAPVAEAAAAAVAEAPAVEPATGSQPAAAAEPVPAAEPSVAASEAAQGQPAAQASAQPAAAGAGGPLPEKLCADLQNPAALQRVWQQVMTTLKNKAAAHGVLFLGTKAVFDAATSTLKIEFPVENEFAFSTANKANVQEELAEAIQHVCGTPMAFMLTKGGAAAAPAAQAASTAQPAAARTEPQAQAQPQARPQPTSEPAPDNAVPYDEVPLDAYDDIAPWDDAPAPSPSYEAAPAAQAAQAPEAAPAAEPSAQPASQPSAQPEPAAAGAAPEPSATVLPDNPDLDATLAAAFGEGAFFTEVTE
ncbi:MAG: DNA polymerase III subunit gamma/tau [Eggerthellaceae bacterium]|nr:DNA polymerase III subunit gamma/tau [Eggerthellaceae bacterium]